MAMKSLFKRVIDGVDVVYDFLYVSFGGVFAFDKLELSSSFLGRVFNEFTVGPKCVSYRRGLVCDVSVYVEPEVCIPGWCVLVLQCPVYRLVGPLVLGGR